LIVIAIQLSHWLANQTESEYRQKLQKVDDYLHSGDCYQINFSQRFEATYQGSEWQAYQLLRDVNKAPFSSFIRLENSCILSVSPERFLQVKGGMVETKPIKGTRKRAQNSEDDRKLSEELLSSEKDRAENLMIVDLLRNDLSKHCEPHSVVVPALFKLESYPAVHHMVSTILGRLKATSSPIKLLKGAFPGGSITGAPKHRAMQIIQELEPDKRSIYCGSIGYIGIRDDMDTSICIRTVLAENNHLYCWAGGGIVLDSDIASEYQESLDKVAKILPILEETMQTEESPQENIVNAAAVNINRTWIKQQHE
jgi:para-aminobenzoate synthetase component 1